MACHKTLKAGDTLYVGDVRIYTATKAQLSVDAARETLIIHATKGQEAAQIETNKPTKE